jgi:hypothetical protein
MSKHTPEPYPHQIGRVRAMIAGTGEYDGLTSQDRTAIRTVFGERVAFLDACTGDPFATQLDWLQSHLHDLRRDKEPDRWGDPEAGWACVQALEKLHADLSALCAQAGAFEPDTRLADLLAAAKGIAPGVMCIKEQITGTACGKPNCPACDLHKAIARAESEATP